MARSVRSRSEREHCWHQEHVAPLAIQRKVSQQLFQNCIRGKIISYSQNDLQAVQNKVIVILIGKAISHHFFGDVRDKFLKEGDLKKLIECNQLQICQTTFADAGRRSAIGKSSMGTLLDTL